MRLSTPALASHARRDKRCHPVQQEKRAKVTLEPEESVGRSREAAFRIGACMESRLSPSRMHRDHEPRMCKCLEINRGLFRFMERARNALSRQFGLRFDPAPV